MATIALLPDRGRTGAELGYITRAAHAVGMQQPTRSHQLRQQEEALGSTLFVRHPKGVRLTEAGRLLAQEVTRLLATRAEGGCERRSVFEPTPG